MKAILRNRRTGLYFQGGAAWTRHPQDALDYGDIEGALEAALDSRMASLELNLLLFDDPRYTVRLALGGFFSKPANVPARNGRSPGSQYRYRIDESKVHPGKIVYGARPRRVPA